MWVHMLTDSALQLLTLLLSHVIVNHPDTQRLYTLLL